MLKTFPQQLSQYGRGGTIISVVAVGGNNSKAEERPDNYVSTIDEYRKEMSELLDLLKARSSAVIFVGSGFVDETKITPKLSPLSGKKSYFTNSRREEFAECVKMLCKERKIPFIDVGVSEKEWKRKYLYTDGLHSNARGHELINRKVLAEVEKYLK